MSQRLGISVLTLFIALVTAANAAFAQEFPQRPIRLIVPWSVATPPDLTARLVAIKASQSLGQQILIENRAGAGGTVGLMEFIKQPADGYTLATIGSTATLTPVLYPQLAVDLRKDLAPIVLLESFANVLVVGNASPIKSVADLVTLLKAKPGQLSFGSGGNATPAHMSGELFKQLSGTSATHVPYNVFPQAIGDVIAGRLDYMFLASPASVPQIKGGKLRGLAVTGGKRIAGIEDIATMRESGFPDFVVESWDSIVAPAGTPAAIINRLNAEFVKALATPEVKEGLAKMAAEPLGGSPRELADRIDRDIERWGKVARTANLKAD